ncbi:hypothetical protein Tco_1548165 [Tanacetum coccineum]
MLGSKDSMMILELILLSSITYASALFSSALFSSVLETSSTSSSDLESELLKLLELSFGSLGTSGIIPDHLLEPLESLKIATVRRVSIIRRIKMKIAYHDYLRDKYEIFCPITTEEKAQKKNDVKARSMLLMALPNEHLMTFNQYKDAKTLFAAIQTRFGGNEATKKTQKTLLEQIRSQFEFLRSLPSKWNTHVVVWRNKPDLDIMSFDDLYNNFKIVEQEVKGTTSSSSSSSSQNITFVSSPSSTNEVNTAYRVSIANTQVSPASTQVSTASTQVSTANLSDDNVYAFLASQPNGSQLVYEDLEQIYEDDIEEMDLKWQLALLSMRTRWECRRPRNQDSRNRNQDSSRRTVNVEETSSKAMVAIDESGFDWSYTADEEVPTNMALMFNKSEFNLATYKRGLASVEEQLVFYKKNEVIFCEQLAILKRDISYKDSELSMLKSELEKLKQEKENNQLKIENFENASKRSLDKLIGSQITDKSKKGVGFLSYNAVPPPLTGLFLPPKFDLSNSGLEEFQQPEFEGYGPKTSKSVSEDISNEELVSDDKLEKKNVFPTVTKIEFVRPKQQEKPVRKLVKYAEKYSFDHVQAHCNYHQRERVVSGNNYTRVNYNYFAKKTHPSAQRNMVPRAVLMKTGLRSLNTARPVNTAHPKTKVNNARPMPKAVNTTRPNSAVVNDVRENQANASHPQKEDQGYVDSGCSRNMTGNMSYLSDFKEFDGGYVTFGGGAKGGKITSKGTLKTVKLDFKDVLLKVPRKNNMYSVDMKNIVPKESLSCLFANATFDESMLSHKRLVYRQNINDPSETLIWPALGPVLVWPVK